MKKKQEVQQARKRRSNLELGKFSHGAHLRAIKKISQMAQVPIKRVFDDVIENGIASVLSSYKPMIEMEAERKLRFARLKNLLNDEQPISEPVGSGSAEGENGTGDESSDITAVERPAGRVTLDFTNATLTGLDDADVGPGYIPEADTYPGSVTADGEIITNP